MLNYCKVLAAAFGRIRGACAASAHITIDPREAPAGSYAKLVFRIPHGCDGSATTRIQVTIPAGVSDVKPQVHPGWQIEIKATKKSAGAHDDKQAGAAMTVSWSGGPLPDAYMDEFGLSVKLPDDFGRQLYFPTQQTCEKGAANWADASGGGHHGSGHALPAPNLKLTAPK
jgi:uncharacterized protein YcnI